jgi:hypothetical protein
MSTDAIHRRLGEITASIKAGLDQQLSENGPRAVELLRTVAANRDDLMVKLAQADDESSRLRAALASILEPAEASSFEAVWRMRKIAQEALAK